MFWSYLLVDVNISYSYISDGTGHRKYGKLFVWWVYVIQAVMVSNTVYGEKASEFFSIHCSPQKKDFLRKQFIAPYQVSGVI